MWLGLRDSKRTITDLLESLPKGYIETEETKGTFNLPPSVLTYNGKVLPSHIIHQRMIEDLNRIMTLSILLNG